MPQDGRQPRTLRLPDARPTTVADVQYIATAAVYYPRSATKSLMGNSKYKTEMNKHARNYMPLLNSVQCNTLIALWSPDSSWPRAAVALGDIGYMLPDGGFLSVFNCFLDYEENELRGYSPPPNYTSFWSTSCLPLKRNVDYRINQKTICREEELLISFGQMECNLHKKSGSDTNPSKFIVTCNNVDSYGSALFLPRGGEVEELMQVMEKEVIARIEGDATHWLGHCESIKDSMDLGDAQLFLVTQRCIAPCWTAISYIKPTKKDEQRTLGTFTAEASHASHSVYRWTHGIGKGMIPSSGPPLAEIPQILAAENALRNSTLPYNICVGVGGLVVEYETKRKPLPRYAWAASDSKSILSYFLLEN